MKESLSYWAEIVRFAVRENSLQTPCLLIDERELGRALDHFRSHLSDARLFYAVKANPSPAILTYFGNEGLSLEVASAGEIAAGAALGIPGSRMMLGTPYKTPATLEALFTHRVGACAVDSVGEIERIAGYRERNDFVYRPKIFIRFRVESSCVAINLNTKFGCAHDEVVPLIKRVLELGFPIGGLSFHVGSQSLTPENHIRGIDTAIRLAKEAWEKLHVQVPVIDIGGGFCDRQSAAAAGFSYEGYFEAIGVACGRAVREGFQVYAEPGRALVAGAGLAVTSVIGKNARDGQRWAYLDDGIYGNFSLAMYERPAMSFHVVDVGQREHASAAETVSWVLGGPTGDSLDVITVGAKLPVGLEIGDVLISPNFGAYSTATASAFNGIQPPKSYLVRRRAQTEALEAAPSERIESEATEQLSLMAVESPARPV